MPPRPPPSRNKRLRLLRGLLVILFLGGSLVALQAVLGLPAPLREAVLAPLAQQGLPATVRRMYWLPDRGLVLEKLEIFSPLDRVTPWLTFETLRIRPGIRQRLRQGVWSAKLFPSGGRLQTELGVWTGELQPRGRLLLEDLEGDLRVFPDRLVLHHARGRLGTLLLHLQGEIPLGPMQEEAAPDTDWIAQTADVLAEILAVVGEFTFDPPALLQADLTPSPVSGERVQVTGGLTFRGEGVHRGYPFVRLDARVSYLDHTLDVETARFEGADGAGLNAQARVNFRQQLASLWIQNQLPRAAVEHLSPIPLSRVLEDLALRVEGRSNVDLHFGPSPFTAFGQKVRGHVDVSEAFYRDAFFPELSLDLDFADNVLILENIQAEVGQGRQRGPASGALRYDHASGELILQAEAAFNPAAILSLVDQEEAEQALREWMFTGPPPHIALQLRQQNRDAPLRMSLQVDAREVLSRGTFFAEVNARLELTEETLRIYPLRATRGDAWLEGDLTWLLEEDLLRVEALSTFPLPDLAPLIGPEAVTLLQPYRFRGENWLRVHGTVDLTDAHRNELQGKAHLHDVIWEWMIFDQLTFSFDLQGQSLASDDFHGILNLGAAEGFLRFEQIFDPREASFQAKISGQNIDLFQLITAATDTLDTPYTGRLSFEFDLFGSLNDFPDRPLFHTFGGDGRLEIREGELFRIPLLLGLSRILSRVVRGFGYASQTNFRADVRVGEGRISSRNLFLEGRLLSIEGDGHIGFDNSIHANMKVQLLSQGVIADVLNALLWPVRKLIEVRLSGTLDEPVWYPRNLPRELF